MLTRLSSVCALLCSSLLRFLLQGLGNNEGVEPRNALFKSEAPPLSLESARAAITHWGGRKEDITHVSDTHSDSGVAVLAAAALLLL